MKRSTALALLREYTKTLIIALGLAFAIRASVVEAFRIPSGSMENTLLVGDRFFANKFIYGASVPFTHLKLPAVRPPKPGDVIIFKFPEDMSTTFVKRVVATAGQTVEIRDKRVLVDGRVVREWFGVKHDDPRVVPALDGTRDYFGPVTVPRGYLFVMGDNRDVSYDSRYWGFLDERLVLGKAEVVFWSWDDDAFVPLLHRVRWDRIGHWLG